MKNRMHECGYCGLGPLARVALKRSNRFFPRHDYNKLRMRRGDSLRTSQTFCGPREKCGRRNIQPRNRNEGSGFFFAYRSIDPLFQSFAVVRVGIASID